jgi:hypothetical protein
MCWLAVIARCVTVVNTSLLTLALYRCCSVLLYSFALQQTVVQAEPDATTGCCRARVQSI